MSYGAVTVVNAIPCGTGAAVGIDLKTRACFVAGGSGKGVRIINDPDEDTGMAMICVKNVFEHFGVMEPDDWSLSVDSEIPVSRGLKSSSSACNAVISAVSGWIRNEHGRGFNDKEEDTIEMIRLGTRCAREANVTVTGAFDDACACHLGGLVITDNKNDTILRRTAAEEYDVILLVPDRKIRKPSLDKQRLYALSERMTDILRLAERDWLSALTENGRLVAIALNIEDRVSTSAVNNGALAAGVSGTGPAVSVVVAKGDGKSFLKDLDHDGYISIVTRTR